MKALRKPVRREVFVLTPDEKRAAACVLGAFLLGLATLHYRANHPPTPPASSEKEQRAAKSAVTRSRGAQRAPTPRAPAAAVENDTAADEESRGEE